MEQEKRMKDRISNYFKDALKVLQVENVETDGPIGSSATTNAICSVVEAILMHGLKGMSEKTLWGFLKKYSHNFMQEQIACLNQISTDVGRCRAWVRIAINDCTLESYMRTFVTDRNTLGRCYTSLAYLRDTEQTSVMMTCLQGLSNFQFSLPTNASLLNQWTLIPMQLIGISPAMNLVMPQPSPKPAMTVYQLRCTDHMRSMTPNPSLNINQNNGQSVVQPNFQAEQNMSPLVGNVPHIKMSASCPQGLDNAQAVAAPSKYEPMYLTQDEIDVMRDLTLSRQDGSSTPTSVTSHPDFHDGRQDFYKTVYDVSEEGEEDDEGEDVSESDHAMREKMDARFDRIVKQNLERYPLNYDRDRLAKKNNKEKDAENIVVATDVLETSPIPDVGTPDVNSNPQPPDADFLRLDLKLDSLAENQDGCSNDGCSNSESKHSDFNKNCEMNCEVNSNDDVQNHVAIEPVHQVIEVEASYASLFTTHSTKTMLSVADVIKTLPTVEEATTPTPGVGPISPSSPENPFHSSDDNDTLDESQSVDNQDSKSNGKYLSISLSHEKGLAHQNFQCKDCSAPIGMFFGKENVCSFDGCYYCNDCHMDDLSCIPAKIVFNWDFRTYKVSKRNLELLTEVFEEPVVNIENLNIMLYEHVKALDNVKTIRTQLRFLKSYLHTCTQTLVVELENRVNKKSYYFENIHTYSLKDLTQVPSGALAKKLKKVVDFATHHVYGCVLCSQKGFYCEICRDKKVIYPFETSSTVRCDICRAVYHSNCKTSMVPCPKCERKRLRDINLQAVSRDPLESVDFSFPDHSLS